MTFGPLTVTVINIDSGAEDRYGNPARAVTGTYTLEGCNLQQRTTDEELVDRATTVTEWLLFAPPPGAGEAIRARDQIRIDATAAHVAPDAGQTYATFELVGEPDYLDNIDGVTHHLELVLQRVQL